MITKMFSRLPGKFQDPGYFQAPWKIPGGSLSPVRHAVLNDGWYVTDEEFKNAIRDGGSALLFTVYTVHNVQIAILCSNSNMAAHIYC